MTRHAPPLALALAALAGPAAAQDLMLIPDSATDRVWAFSAADGSLVTDSYIADPGAPGGVDAFNRPIEVMESATGTLLVTDQFADVVSEFTAAGAFIRVFSLGGVKDSAVMDNIRGGHVLTTGPNAGDVLVCNAGNTNPLTVSQDNVKSLDPADGSEQADFAFNRYGGIRGPFDALEYNGDVLISTDTQNALVKFTPDGAFNERFTSSFDFPQIDFPQQMAEALNGNLLVCCFSSGVILEFAPDATLVGQYDPGTLSLYRGIAELDNGNLLVTTTTGVHEITRTGLVVATEAAGTDFRYVTRFTPPAPPVPARAAAPVTPIEETRTLEQAIADERGTTEAE
ncbi:MAG: hypothetical protein DHS20C14_04150 [Phycisphaeraceae bacterium]|nr:MAG: hypothetical protein DHS20C14_04150 [Phycisphaeraceae bacterium]